MRDFTKEGYYDIVVRFPSKEVAEEFCSQMSDGFGEGFCNFNDSIQREGTTGKNNEDYYSHPPVDTVAPNTPVWMVEELFEL
jgi:hypothetical protein